MRSKLRIAILESQAPEEFTKPMAGKPVNDILALCEFSSSFQVVVARSSLAAGMLSLHQRCSTDPSLVPLLHLILPDRPGGFALTSRETVRWKGLAEALTALDQGLSGRLHVSIQGPIGFRSLAAAYDASLQPPQAVIGPTGNTTTRQAALALALYVHGVSAGTDPRHVVSAFEPVVGQGFGWFGEPARRDVAAGPALRVDDLLPLLS